MRFIRCLSVMLLSVLMIAFLVSCVAEIPNKNSDTNQKEDKSYTVTFESNGGEVVEAQKIKENQELSLPNEPTKEGYKFDGWFLNAELTTEASFPITVNKDTTLYAKWLKYHKVTFVSNGGTDVEALTVTEKDAVDNIGSPRKDYHSFDGWYLDEGLTTVAIFPLNVNKDTVLYAKWLKVDDTVQLGNASLKCWSGYNDTATYYVTPAGFDLERLNQLGYTMKIHVSYYLSYKKDYDVPLGIGYAGKPEYNVSLINSKNHGAIYENMDTTDSRIYQSFELIVNISDLKGEQFRLIFNTDNIQNIVIFENITVSYSCY
ncbi:MAG: InlB B-repeat-containing protein [Clostridia bacterium]|nr:InlB B-repeat-containing protein [Clostridia bacterium]